MPKEIKTTPYMQLLEKVWGKMKENGELEKLDDDAQVEKVVSTVEGMLSTTDAKRFLKKS